MMAAVSRNLVLLASCGLGACTTTGSYQRWEGLRAQPAYAPWVSCIEQQTRLRMTSALDDRPPTPEAVEAAGKTDGEVFVLILDACRSRMAGFGSGIREEPRNKRMLMDAYDRYRREISTIRAAEEAAIT